MQNLGRSVFGAAMVAVAVGFGSLAIRQASAQEQKGLKEAQEPTTAKAAVAVEPPQATFAGWDRLGRRPETFVLNKDKGVGVFTIFGADGSVKYVANTLEYRQTDAHNFAYYEAEGLKLEYAFLTKGTQFNPVYVRTKGSLPWRIEGDFERHMADGNYFTP